MPGPQCWLPTATATTALLHRNSQMTLPNPTGPLCRISVNTTTAALSALELYRRLWPVPCAGYLLRPKARSCSHMSFMDGCGRSPVQDAC